MRTLLGVDLGGTSLRLLAEGPDGTRGPLTRRAAPASYEGLLAAVAACADETGGVPSIGIGIPGTTDGVRAGFVPALPWLEGRDLGTDLRTRTGAGDVVVANDGQLTLLAESRHGAARDAGSAILVTVGTGVGGAVMIGGRLWRGAHGSAGSWGWLSAPDAVPDTAHGPFEQVAAGRALDRLAGPEGAERLVDRARGGDAAAHAVVDVYARRLGRGVAALCGVLDPEIVVVAGGMADAFDVVGPIMEEERSRWTSPDGRRTRVVPAALGPSAGVRGALEAARDGVEVWV